MTVFLLTLGGCTFSVVDRIITFAKRPTATTIAVDSSRKKISFPAVTICNLNSVRLSYASEHNLTRLMSYIQNPFVYNSTTCRQILDDAISGTLFNPPLRQVYYDGQSMMEEFVLYCAFFGSDFSLLNCKENFSVKLTDLGYCFTFNGFANESEKYVNGAGARYGLHMLLNINQTEYLPSFSEAGIKVAIHPRGVPPQPYSRGIAIPAGRSAFIGMRKSTIVDESAQSNCGKKDLQFFQSSRYNYSVSACQLSNTYADVADGCNCLDALYDSIYLEENGLPDCTVANVCCVADHHLIGDPGTSCPESCSYTRYDATTTYSTFPSVNSATWIADFFNYTITSTNITDNLISVNVFFEDLNTQTITTENSYTITALLSDIGGQLGLFLGASVVSVIELCVYCFDETIDSTRGCSRKLSVVPSDDDDDDDETGIMLGHKESEKKHLPSDSYHSDRTVTT